MSRFIDADRLRKEVRRLEKAAHKSALGCADSETRRFHEGKDFAYQYVGALIASLQQEQPDPKELPTLRQAIEEHMYDYIIHKIPACPPHSGITVSLTLRPSTVRKLKKDYEQNGIPATAVGKVFTNTDPKNLYVESDKWDALLDQFDNGQRVRIILVKEDEK